MKNRVSVSAQVEKRNILLKEGKSPNIFAPTAIEERTEKIKERFKPKVFKIKDYVM